MNKAHQPKVKYLAPSLQGYILANDLICRTPMRLTRCEAGSASGPALSYGQYFKGIRDVISKDGYRLLVDATARQLARDISITDLDEILIYAEKHGSDYHPARIEIVAGGVPASFVMNVAVTERGKVWLCREFEVLQYLNSKYDFPFLPRTYFQGEAFLPSMLMFLADWFQGYHEFHLSIDKEDGSQKLLLWATDKGRCYLSRPQAWQIYSQAAKILTLYYDIQTFEQIFPWHHASGDFVVKPQKVTVHPPPPRPSPARGEGAINRETYSPPSPCGRGLGGGGCERLPQKKSIDVRLITARQYAPMLDRSAGVSVHEALLLFLLNLSVRMRLDRLDGIGDVAWADDECVDATLEGFLAGLRTKERQRVIEMGFVDGFVQHVRSFAKEELSDRFHALIDACDQTAPDIPVIRRHLERHVSKFYSALQRNLLNNPPQPET